MHEIMAGTGNPKLLYYKSACTTTVSNPNTTTTGCIKLHSSSTLRGIESVSNCKLVSIEIIMLTQIKLRLATPESTSLGKLAVPSISPQGPMID
jgi:hypothetical protein